MKVFDANDLRESDLEYLKYGGYLTLSQSGSSKYLVNGYKMAKKLNLTCINVVNVEDSNLNNASTEFQDKGEKKIGLFMKSGYCQCDIKSFVPQIVCMALVALWFSDNKSKIVDSKIYIFLKQPYRVN